MDRKFSWRTAIGAAVLLAFVSVLMVLSWRHWSELDQLFPMFWWSAGAEAIVALSGLYLVRKPIVTVAILVFALSFEAGTLNEPLQPVASLFGAAPVAPAAVEGVERLDAEVKALHERRADLASEDAERVQRAILAVDPALAVEFDGKLGRETREAAARADALVVAQLTPLVAERDAAQRRVDDLAPALAQYRAERLRWTVQTWLTVAAALALNLLLSHLAFGPDRGERPRKTAPAEPQGEAEATEPEERPGYLRVIEAPSPRRPHGRTYWRKIA